PHPRSRTGQRLGHCAPGEARGRRALARARSRRPLRALGGRRAQRARRRRARPVATVGPAPRRGGRRAPRGGTVPQTSEAMRHEWPRRVAALSQLRVTDINVAELSRDDDHHLRRVLRAREGEELVLCDGRGSWRFAHVGSVGLVDVGEVFIDEPSPATTLYLAPLKGERGEWAIAKATEVGVSEVVPLVSERLAQKFRGETRDKVLSRWRRIAAETAGQCRRTYDVVIAEPVTAGEVPAHVAVADFAGSGDWRGVTSVAVGPEGG